MHDREGRIRAGVCAGGQLECAGGLPRIGPMLAGIGPTDRSGGGWSRRTNPARAGAGAASRARITLFLPTKKSLAALLRYAAGRNGDCVLCMRDITRELRPRSLGREQTGATARERCRCFTPRRRRRRPMLARKGDQTSKLGDPPANLSKSTKVSPKPQSETPGRAGLEKIPFRIAQRPIKGHLRAAFQNMSWKRPRETRRLWRLAMAGVI